METALYIIYNLSINKLLIYNKFLDNLNDLLILLINTYVQVLKIKYKKMIMYNFSYLCNSVGKYQI